MSELLSRVRRGARAVVGWVRSQVAGNTAAVVAVSGAAIVLLAGIGIAVVIHSGSDRAVQTNGGRADPRSDVVRSVEMKDFRFPRIRLEGPEGDFFRYRDPASAWSEEDVQRLWLDLEEEAVDIVREENSDLLEELLRVNP